MDIGQQVMPHALWHHVGMNDERRRRLRRLGRAYRSAMEAEKKAREALAAEVLAALAAEEPVGEVAREAGFDREWVRRARVAEEKRLADEAQAEVDRARTAAIQHRLDQLASKKPEVSTNVEDSPES